MSRWATSPAMAKAISLAGLLPWANGGWGGRPAPRSLPLVGPRGGRVSPGLMFKWPISTVTARPTSPAERWKSASGGRDWQRAPVSTQLSGPLGLRASAGWMCAWAKTFNAPKEHRSIWRFGLTTAKSLFYPSIESVPNFAVGLAANLDKDNLIPLGG